MNRKTELLSPAGDSESFLYALDYGADAVYLGGKAFGMRAGAKNFTEEELCSAVQTAHKKGVKVYITCNIVPSNDEIERFPEFISAAANAGVSLEDIEMAKAMNDIFKNFTPLNIILVFVIFILGFLFFALISALVGASVSRMEDLAAAMQPFSIMCVLGMYLAYFPVIFNAENLADGVNELNPVQVFSYYFPLSSPFALPGAILLGNFNAIQSIIAVVVLAACVVLIAIVVSKVYEAIILHNGNRIKFGDIIKMATRK